MSHCNNHVPVVYNLHPLLCGFTATTVHLEDLQPETAKNSK